MAESSSFKTVVLISSISSLIQGIAWCVLSLMAIFCYTCVLKPGPFKYKKEIRLTYQHYLAAYFQGSCNEDLNFYKEMNQVSSPEKVLFMVIIVYIFNFIMVLSSVIIMFALRSKRRHIVFGWLIFYLIITFCVAVLDLVCTGVVTSDYFAVASSNMTNLGLASLSLIILMIITCRGVLLWISNLVFSLYLASFLCRSRDNQMTPLIQSTNSLVNKEDGTSAMPTPERTFKIDNKTLENRPIAILGCGDDRPTQAEYPSYCAYSRWPRLHPDNKISRPASLPTPSHLVHQERQHKQQQLLHYQPQQHHQPQAQYYRPQNRPPPPPVKPLYRAHREGPMREQESGQSDMRPGSLQEAILTLRPLKQVRPRITAIPDGYP